ncbi:MAG: hypothetical protein NDI73_08165, partial [Desulfuromonadales bacterium]|nr:hypothetical protein [Desulfuromonadales bacterium]
GGQKLACGADSLSFASAPANARQLKKSFDLKLSQAQADRRGNFAGRTNCLSQRRVFVQPEKFSRLPAFGTIGYRNSG